ncbi:hypothetical protein [Pseudorhodoplanes sp.]|uniref:hypothetical protein n=1 Tax=Pseudorhodoplanes sp. TaxID=1934341 RepID=UPI002CA1307C|nr:hypothetical protein [Pseudorhodoplanes sp.]HWV53116.1 hypothetical protein [Pseudorhodoplanes sp.]
MDNKAGIQASVDVSQLPTPVELTKLIRKLRWIGLEDEARQLQVVLDRFPQDQRAVLPGTPIDCD